MINHYLELGVSEEATDIEIKRAYRNLIKKYHPDVSTFPDAAERSEGVISSYGVLSCPKSRFAHDLELKKAGLLSKVLFNKNRYSCPGCSGTGEVNVRPDTGFGIWNNFVYNFRNVLTQEKQLTRTCLECCGQGIIYRIEEI